MIVLWHHILHCGQHVDPYVQIMCWFRADTLPCYSSTPLRHQNESAVRALSLSYGVRHT